jgi:hypothetical protein
LSKSKKKKKLVKKIEEQNGTYGVVIDDARHFELHLNFVLVPPSYSERKATPARICERGVGCGHIVVVDNKN